MPYERIVGLTIVDQDGYTQYRKEIRPLLEESGAAFRYDFVVANVLHSEPGEQINRTFVIRFPDRERNDQFFADPRYVEIRRRLFEPSVGASIVIAEYETKAAQT